MHWYNEIQRGVAVPGQEPWCSEPLPPPPGRMVPPTVWLNNHRPGDMRAGPASWVGREGPGATGSKAQRHCRALVEQRVCVCGGGTSVWMCPEDSAAQWRQLSHQSRPEG